MKVAIFLYDDMLLPPDKDQIRKKALFLFFLLFYCMSKALTKILENVLLLLLKGQHGNKTICFETTIDFNKDELDTLNNFAIQYEGSSEEKVPNILLNFLFALEKINVLLDNYLPKDYEKYLVQS